MGQRQRIMIVIPPFCVLANLRPFLGPALLKPILEKEGYEIRLIDTIPTFYDNMNISYDKEWRSNHIIMEMLEIFSMQDLDSFGNCLKSDILMELNNIVREIIDYKPHVCCFSVPFRPNFMSAVWIAREVKRALNCKTIVGGSLITIPALDHIRNAVPANIIDIFIIGEGENTLPKVLRCLLGHGKTDNQPIEELGKISGICFFENNQTGEYSHREKNAQLLTTGAPRDIPSDLDSLPYSDLSDYELFKYPLQALSISNSRGCIARCKFCNSRKIHPKFRMRSGANVAQEIYEKYESTGIRRFDFMDNLINGDHRKLMEYCQIMKKMKLPVISWGMPRLTKYFDEESIELLAAAGFKSLTVAIESGSAKVRKDMGKYGDQKHVENIIKWMIKHKIWPFLYIMHSYPTESDGDFQQSLDFLDKFSQQEIGWVAWPFNLAGVTSGVIDEEFIKSYGITITKIGNPNPGYWYFGYQIEWHNDLINPMVVEKRSALIEEFRQEWLGKGSQKEMEVPEAGLIT